MKYILGFIYLFFCFTVSGQQLDRVNFLQIDAIIEPVVATKQVKGKMTVQFEVLKPTNQVYLDARSMEINSVETSLIEVAAQQTKIVLSASFAPGNVYTATFSYTAKPKQTVYFTGNQIWTQGQGKYTSHWLPSLDDVQDKMVFNISILGESGKTVLANGKLSSVEVKDGMKQWNYIMEKPMSSYLVAFVIGDFIVEEQSSLSGIPLQLYIDKEQKNKIEPTYRYTQEIFNFYEEELGVPYPWQNYKQVPVRDFLYAGMENTSLTIFSEAFVVDSIGFTDRNYVNVNAHEMAHHWFGNLVTETESKHHWLQEGFSTYYALLAEKEIFGDAYYYWKLYQSAEQLKSISDSGKGEALLNPLASSLTFYEKGAWALHILREKIGEEAFKKAITSYLKVYGYKNATTDQFLEIVQEQTTVSLVDFKRDWLEQSAFKAEQAYNSLKKSEFMQEYFKIAALRETTFEDKEQQLKNGLLLDNDFIGQEIISQLSLEPITKTLPLYKIALKSSSVYVRQSVALTLGTIPASLEEELKVLLKDTSYLTQEATLYSLWAQFPANRKEYLDVLDGVQGFQNKNIRQLWLVLACLTDGYQDAKKPSYIRELKAYTSAEYSFEIRELALNYCYELQLFEGESLKNLIASCVHHNWRHRNFARALLSKSLGNEGLKKEIVALMPDLPEAEKAYLVKQLTK